jgi:hypothetical protein
MKRDTPEEEQCVNFFRIAGSGRDRSFELPEVPE